MGSFGLPPEDKRARMDNREDKWRADWVSQRDIQLYLRCPYAFVQIDRRLLPREVMVDELSERLMKEGLAFHTDVYATAMPRRRKSLPEALRGDKLFVEPTWFMNRHLKISGLVDGVDPAGGALYPIEVKSHKDVRKDDLWELAFYWLLLDEWRTKPAPPRGTLILRRELKPDWVDVELKDEHFDRVRELIQQIRDARRYGVRRRVCDCPVCSETLNEWVSGQISEGKDLTLIWGIGRPYAAALEAMGIADYHALEDWDPIAIAAGMKERGYSISTTQVEKWQLHARSYRQTEVVRFGAPLAAGKDFIALDLEYDQHDPFIWLIGLLISAGKRREQVFLWADTRREERDNLCALGELVRTQAALPVITWSGTAADLPMLKGAALRHRLGDGLDPLFERHVDLFTFASHSFRLPQPSLSLKAVAAHFAIERTSTIHNGLEAQMLYGRYRRTRSRTEKARLHEELLAYNRDDLETLAGVHQAIREMQAL